MQLLRCDQPLQPGGPAPEGAQATRAEGVPPARAHCRLRGLREEVGFDELVIITAGESWARELGDFDGAHRHADFQPREKTGQPVTKIEVGVQDRRHLGDGGQKVGGTG